MEFFKKITDFIQDLEEKDFYKYIIIFFACLFIIISYMIYSYYSDISKYSQDIEEINNTRNDKVRTLLTEFGNLEIQRKEADDILKKDVDFQIKGYFEKLLSKLILTEYRKEDFPAIERDVDEKYRETEFSVELSGMDMAQLCELLKELENMRRITIRTLEITKSQKKADAIDVKLTISTLSLKTEVTT